jgi:spore coat polysaccharide biosynthesis protein SpsF
MKRVVIVQARMTSTRLPGKILADLAGRPMLAQQIARIGKCRNVDEIVIATTTNATDDPVAALATDEKVGLFRGSEHDVLARYVGAAHAAHADVVVRITADCPLLDPGIVDRVIDCLLEEPCDYASNTAVRTFPRGLDVEALHVDALLRTARLGTSQMAREHVTWFIHQDRPDLFLRRSVRDPVDNSDLRWTVDTPDDLELVRRIYQESPPGHDYRALIEWLRTRPDLIRLNAHIAQSTV